MSAPLQMLLCSSIASDAELAAVASALDQFIHRSLGALLRQLRIGNPELLGWFGSAWGAEELAELHQELLVHTLDKLPLLQTKARAGQFHEGYLWRLLENRLQQLRRGAAPVASAAQRRIRSSIRRQVALGVLLPTHPADPSAVPRDVSFSPRQAVPPASREQLNHARDSFAEGSQLAQELANRGHRETRVLGRFWPHLLASGVHRFLTRELCAALVPGAPRLAVAPDDLAAPEVPEAADLVLSRWRRLVQDGAVQHPHRVALLAVAEHVFDAAACGLPVRVVDIAKALNVPKQRASEWLGWVRSLLAQSGESG